MFKGRSETCPYNMCLSQAGQNMSIPYRKFIPVLMLLILVVLLWLPFGLKQDIGSYEEWLILGRIQRGEPTLFLNDYPTRVFNFMPFAVAHALAPDSFVGFSLLMVALFAGKALVLYGIVRQLLPQQPGLALVAGALFIIYPADRGLFTFRAINVHFTVFLGLLAIYLLLVWYRQKLGWAWIGIVVLQAVALGIYEVMYPLIFFAPLLLVILEGRLSRRVVHGMALWWVVPMILFTRLSVLLLSGAADFYVRHSSTMLIQEVTVAPKANPISGLFELFGRHFTGWLDAAGQINLSSPLLYLALVAGIMVGGVFYHFHSGKPLTRRQFIGLLVGGAAAVVLGFAAYLVTPYREWRVYFASTAGAALMVAALIGLLRWRWLTGLAVGLVMTFASLYALNQHQFFVDQSREVQHVLSMVDQAPQIRDEATLILMDDGKRYQSEWVLSDRSDVFRDALSFVYGKPVRALRCDQTMTSSEFCELRADTIFHRDQDGNVNIVAYDDALIFEVKADGRLQLLDELPDVPGYQPQANITGAELPARASTLFSCQPTPDCLSNYSS